MIEIRSTRSIRAGLVAASLLIWFGPAYAQLPDHGDTQYYVNYARAVFDGQTPWRDVAIEYPPLALPMFLVPYLFGRSQENYLIAFMTLMGVLNAGLVATTVTAVSKAGRGLKEQSGAGAIVALAPVLIGAGIALSRYDLWSALLVGLAMLLMVSGRTPLAAGALAAGAAAKIWPGLMLLPALALAYRRGGRRELGRAATMVAAFGGLPFVLAIAIGGDGFLDAFEYHLTRPLQIESFASVFLVSLWRFAGIGGPFTDEVSFGSFNLEGPGVHLAADASGLLSLSFVVIANFLGARRVIDAADDDQAVANAVRFGFVAVIAFVAFGKVLSPQFLLWLVPMPFLLDRKRWATALGLALAMGLTGLFFLDYYRFVREFDPLWTAIILIRNLILAGLTSVLLFDPGRPRFGIRRLSSLLNMPSGS